eukprot:216778-Ditylum_brightwellii.AAC.1
MVGRNTGQISGQYPDLQRSTVPMRNLGGLIILKTCADSNITQQALAWAKVGCSHESYQDSEEENITLTLKLIKVSGIDGTVPTLDPNAVGRTTSVAVVGTAGSGEAGGAAGDTGVAGTAWLGMAGAAGTTGATGVATGAGMPPIPPVGFLPGPLGGVAGNVMAIPYDQVLQNNQLDTVDAILEYDDLKEETGGIFDPRTIDVTAARQLGASNWCKWKEAAKTYMDTVVGTK